MRTRRGRDYEVTASDVQEFSDEDAVNAAVDDRYWKKLKPDQIAHFFDRDIVDANPTSSELLANELGTVGLTPDEIKKQALEKETGEFYGDSWGSW